MIGKTTKNNAVEEEMESKQHDDNTSNINFHNFCLLSHICLICQGIKERQNRRKNPQSPDILFLIIELELSSTLVFLLLINEIFFR